MAKLDEKSINKILQDRTLPDFIRSDYPLFVSFISAYFEWLEQAKNPHDIVQNFEYYTNLDHTLDEFLSYFEHELIRSFPKDIVADKKLLARHIKQFYLNKGNEASYKFLFRVLYGENIEFYYPKVDILRASDGKWFEQKSIKVSTDSDINNFNSNQITGNTTGATAIVETSPIFSERGAKIAELTLSDIRGEFQPGEDITIEYIDEDGNLTFFTEKLLSIYTGIDITNGGSSYSINDEFPINDKDDNKIATGRITETKRGPVTSISIAQAGQGYNGNIIEIDKFYALPFDSTLNGDFLPDTVADGSDSNSSGTDYTQYTFDEAISTQLISGTGDPILINDVPSVFDNATGVVEKVNNDGVILEIKLLDGGDNYSDPVAEIDSDTGTGGEINVTGGNGSVSSAILIAFPIVKPSYNIVYNSDNVVYGSDNVAYFSDSDYNSTNDLLVYPDLSNIGDGTATGDMLTGALAEYPGRYLNDDGHLSSTKKLQDSFYWQDFSYVIKSRLSLDKWKDDVKNIIHPAGLKVFGEILFVTSLNTESNLSDSAISIVQTTTTVTENGSTVTENGNDVLVAEPLY